MVPIKLTSIDYTKFSLGAEEESNFIQVSVPSQLLIWISSYSSRSSKFTFELQLCSAGKVVVRSLPITHMVEEVISAPSLVLGTLESGACVTQVLSHQPLIAESVSVPSSEQDRAETACAP